MKRQRNKSPLRLTRDAEKLIAFSTGLASSGSRTEDRYWENAIVNLAGHLLGSGNDAALESALENTFKSNLPAHETLIEFVEAAAESTAVTVEGKQWDLLLIAIPLVAWSKYAVPSGTIPREAVDSIIPHLHGHVLAADARTCMAPFLYSIDQMPRDFSGVYKLSLKLGEAAIAGTTPRFDFAKLPETAPLLADCRFLLASVAVPAGTAMFRWQETEQHTTRAECLERWILQCRPNLARLLPGCAFECLLPDAYFVNCRESDRNVRPFAIRAGVAFLESALKTNASQLHAVIAGFGDERVDEFRIGFLQKGRDEIVHGVVWPLFGREDDDASITPADEVDAILRDCKVGEITKLNELFKPEYCEDCGAPLFADTDGDVSHPELPEEADVAAAHYH